MQKAREASTGSVHRQRKWLRATNTLSLVMHNVIAMKIDFSIDPKCVYLQSRMKIDFSIDPWHKSTFFNRTIMRCRRYHKHFSGGHKL